MLDERWLATVDFEKATERIIDRHVASGVAGSIQVIFHRSFARLALITKQEAQWRARENDMPSMFTSPAK